MTFHYAVGLSFIPWACVHTTFDTHAALHTDYFQQMYSPAVPRPNFLHGFAFILHAVSLLAPQ